MSIKNIIIWTGMVCVIVHANRVQLFFLDCGPLASHYLLAIFDASISCYTKWIGSILVLQRYMYSLINCIYDIITYAKNFDTLVSDHPKIDCKFNMDRQACKIEMCAP